ncbi:MAG TPA: amidohydrolase, partial [Alteromonas macleodii]|nr:amidohydrolase [Alteromonas macleodii]
MSKPSITWIDPHIHFFASNEGHYGWLKPANAPFWPDKKAIAKHTTEHML